MRAVVASLIVAATIAAAACSGGPETTASATPAPTVLKLAQENVATAATAELSSGPQVSGQLTPAREATVRAQVGGSIVALTVDRGQPVKRGAVIAKIASRDLDAAMAAAEAQIRSADTALNVARTELQRTEVLVKGGALDRCLARAIFVVGPDDKIKHVEYVGEISAHPNYEAALAAAK